MNIATCFGKLVSRLQPSDNEKALAQQHLYTIKNRLTATFNIRRFLTGGSYSRGTFIRGGSDVDLFAVISKKDVTWGNGLVSSETAINNIRAELLKRYPTTPVERDVQAVVVPFSQGASVDVVPAVFDQMLNGKLPLYLIPDGDRDWMPTCPELHANYIRQADAKSGGKLKRVAQLLKYWRECRSPRVPLSSFHIEMVLASEDICIGIKSYAACVTETLHSWLNGNVAPCKTRWELRATFRRSERRRNGKAPSRQCGIHATTRRTRAGTTTLAIQMRRGLSGTLSSTTLFPNDSEPAHEW